MHAQTFSSLNHTTLRATAIALALIGALHAGRGHAQDDPAHSGVTDDAPGMVMPQQDTEPSAPDAGSSAADPTLAPDQEANAEQPNAPDATVLFDPGTAELTPEATAILDAVRQKFGSNEESAILLTGHTDPVESAAGANVLSQARALAVGTYLNKAGVPADHIVVRAVGDRALAANPSSCGNLDGEALARCLAPDRAVDIEVVASTAEAPLRKSDDESATSQDAK